MELLGYRLSVLDIDLTTVFIFMLVFLLAYLCTRKPPGIPPGSAFTLPVIGDLPLLFGTGGDIVATFRNLRKKHGDIFSFYVGRDLMVVINGFELIHKAAVRNGWRFSGRPDGLINNVVTKGRGVILASGPFWKRQRKFTISCLQEFGFGKSSFEEQINKEVQYFVNILEAQNGNPFDLTQPLHAAVENVLFVVLCNKRHDYDSEFYQERLKNAELTAQKLMKVSAILSCIPSLQYLPGDLLDINLVKRLYKQTADHLIELYKEHLEEHDENNPRDFMDMFISKMNKNGQTGDNTDFTLDQMCFLVMDLFGAGAETTASTIAFAVLYLLKYPLVKQRLQSDIDKVIQDDKLPRLEDKEKLPFVEAFIFEVQRVANITPMAIPHSVTSEEDAMFEDYRIPKNATITLNLDSVFTDPNIFENPFNFDPERFLDSGNRVVRPKELIPFGVGRRVCLGEPVAKMELFLFLTTLIKQFDFKSETGKEVQTIDSEMGTLVQRPKPFKVRAIKRS